MSKGLIHKLLTFLVLFIGFTLLLSYLSSYVSPTIFYLPTFLNLFYLPLIFSVFVLLLISVFFRRWKDFIFLVFVIIVGFNRHKQYFVLNPKVVSNCDDKVIKLMTYNVRVFNLYDWVKNVRYKNSIINLIHSVSPDILCLQEYVYDERKIFNTRDTLLNLLGYKYYKESFYTEKKYFHFGSAIFSRYPIIDSKAYDLDGGRIFFVFHKIVFPDNDTIYLFNVHLQSIKFSYREYMYLDSLKKNLENKKIQRFVPILKKIKRAFQLHTIQADSIINLIKKSNNKIIVCGDFNDIPGSYTYSMFNEILKDAFVSSGSGFGFTFNRFFLPYRIDFIFVDKRFNTKNTIVIKKSFSDHYPVITNICK